MEKAEELFKKIVAELPDAKEGVMFGAKCIKAPNGKAAAMLYKDYMVFKLQGEELNEALSLDGAQLFDPMGNRPMGGWVEIPQHYAGQWYSWAEKSMDYVKTIKK